MLHVNGTWRRHSGAFVHLFNVKGGQSSESLKCKDWDSYTSLPWEKAHLSCVRDLYAAGYQTSNTLCIKRRERSRRLCRGVCSVQRSSRRGRVDSFTFHYTRLLKYSQSCNRATALLFIATLTPESTAGNSLNQLPQRPAAHGSQSLNVW